MQTRIASPRDTQPTTQRPPRPGAGYFWNGILGEWLRNPAATAKVAKLHCHADGRICALSSDGETRYTVRLGAELSCSCPGFTHHGYCYHLDTALTRFPADAAQPTAVIVPADDTDPEPPTPAAPAVCEWCGQSCERFGCFCCRVEQGGCLCPGCRPDAYPEGEGDELDPAA